MKYNLNHQLDWAETTLHRPVYLFWSLQEHIINENCDLQPGVWKHSARSFSGWWWSLLTNAAVTWITFRGC